MENLFEDDEIVADLQNEEGSFDVVSLLFTFLKLTCYFVYN